MKSFNGTILAVVVCALTVIGLSGCNTFRGAGKDIQRGGEAVEDAAEETQDNMSSVSTPDRGIMLSANSGF
jgi:predicted small secreted protein